MNELNTRTLAWLKLTREGAMDLRAGMRPEEISRVLGTMREYRLPGASLRGLEQLGQLTPRVLSEVSCALRDDALFEIRAQVVLHEAPPKRPLVDAIAAAIDAFAEVRVAKRRWTVGEMTIELRASEDIVLEDDMPICVETSIRWGA